MPTNDLTCSTLFCMQQTTAAHFAQREKFQPTFTFDIAYLPFVQNKVAQNIFREICGSAPINVLTTELFSIYNYFESGMTYFHFSHWKSVLALFPLWVRKSAAAWNSLSLRTKRDTDRDQNLCCWECGSYELWNSTYVLKKTFVNTRTRVPSQGFVFTLSCSVMYFYSFVEYVIQILIFIGDPSEEHNGFSTGLSSLHVQSWKVSGAFCSILKIKLQPEELWPD